MKATALCHGAATIITGFATGKGGAYGISLENKTTVELNESKKIESIVNGEKDMGLVLAESAVKRTLEKFGLNYAGAKVTTETDVPVAAGLKSSSIAANAIVLATAGAIAKEHGDVREVRLSKAESKQEIIIKGENVKGIDLINIGIDAAFDAKVTKTGAIDDASAAFFGGYTLTKNLEREIVYKGGMEELNVLIYLPDRKIYSGSINPADVKPFAKEVDLVWENALKGCIYQAITLNGLIHSVSFKLDPTPAVKALDAGAIAAGLSGTGPAVVALSRDDGASIRDAWSDLEGNIIATKTNNVSARVI
ncbi:MAG: shikimate kinase [Candidatus Altiarchaeota archaeon]|nr:shikimate kinase [Candidatus Altiarchaeota archaeon]